MSSNRVNSITDLSPAGEAALSRILARNPGATTRSTLPDVSPERLPRHIAIIMDGNGRWAKQRGFPREFGHRNGAATVRTIVEESVRIGIETLSLYSFSMENWKRPAAEVEALMDLCHLYLEGERDHMIRRGIRFRTIGRRDGLPSRVLEEIDRVAEATRHGRAMTLCLAINYGSRTEIVDAARQLAADALAGTIDPDAIDEDAIAARLYTRELTDPDLLIRTAGEMRVSNFLLWQISYAELHVTQSLWPDFGPGNLHAAIRDYAGRSRRFGGLDDAT